MIITKIYIFWLIYNLRKINWNTVTVNYLNLECNSWIFSPKTFYIVIRYGANSGYKRTAVHCNATGNVPKILWNHKWVICGYWLDVRRIEHIYRGYSRYPLHCHASFGTGFLQQTGVIIWLERMIAYTNQKWDFFFLSLWVVMRLIFILKWEWS